MPKTDQARMWALCPTSSRWIVVPPHPYSEMALANNEQLEAFVSGVSESTTITGVPVLNRTVNGHGCELRGQTGGTIAGTGRVVSSR